MILRRSLRLFARFAQARIPPFILSLRYLYPKSCQNIQLHRRIFLANCKNPLKLIFNGLIYIRWVSYYTWLGSYRACKHQTEAQLEYYGLSRWALFFDLLHYSICHLISARDYFEFRLYDKKKNLFDYLYTQEIGYFHHRINQSFRNYHRAVELLADKHQFSSVLQNKGIPTVAGVCIETDKFNIKSVAEREAIKRAIFCKPNTGARSEDAFLIKHCAIDNAYQLLPMRGDIITCPFGIESYLKKIAKRHQKILIQPFITDHFAMKQMNTQNAVSTVRIITAKKTSSIDLDSELLYIQLEIPQANISSTVAINKMTQLYTILPLDLETLDVDPEFKKQPFFDQKADVTISVELKKLLRGSIANCLQAHKMLLDLRTVAFDVVIGEDGPMILEGNSHWSLDYFSYVEALGPLHYQSNHPSSRWVKSVMLEIIQ